MRKQSLLNGINHFLKTEDITDPHIAFVLHREKDFVDEYKVMLYLESDPDEIYTVVVKDNEYELYHIFDWDFGIDTHLFEELKDGYEIYHMPLMEHVGVWKIVDNLRGDITCDEGLQLYLEHCQRKGITPDLISKASEEKLNIFDLYKEMNIGYEIIASIDVHTASVVLGRKVSDPKQYVTWYSSPTRKNGYDLGHYFNSFDEAYKDFERRSKELFNTHIESIKQWVRPIKEHELHER